MDGFGESMEMEGNLYMRAKNMNVWKKRRFVHTGNTLQYYSLKKPSKGMLGTFSSALTPKKKEEDVFELTQCSIKTVHEYLSGRPYSFQVSSPSYFLLLSADSHDEMYQWIGSLRSKLTSSPMDKQLQRTRSNSSMMLSPSSTTIQCIAQSREDDIDDFVIMTKMDLHVFLSNCRSASERLIVQNSIYLNSKQLPRGSILIAIDGSSILQPDQPTMIQRMLHEQKLPAKFQLLRSRPKVGVLKSQSYEALGQMLKITPRGTAMMGWKDLACEIDGDCFVSARFLPTNSLSKWSQTLLNPPDQLIDDKPKTASKTVIVLEGATVRLVHEVLSGRPYCFLLSNSSTSLLLQASSEEELIDWMGAIVHAIDLSNGILVGGGVSQSPCVASSRSFSSNDTSFFPQSGIQRNLHHVQDTIFAPEKPTPLLSCQELVDIICFCQHEGRYTEAFQMLTRHTALRAEYWPSIFAWALPTIIPDVSSLSCQEISEEDVIQLQKDIPRTASWLASSDGAPESTVKAPPERLEKLGRILHAFIASSSSTLYLQGMNGIAFVLLQVFSDDEILVFRFLQGIVHGVLPTIFLSEIHADNALVQTGTQLESMVLSYLPSLSHVFEHVGLPVFLLAYKWFPTLFSDVSLQANRKHNQLRYDTLLMAWDICMILGVEGIYCVALALFSAADNAIRNLGPTCLAEEVSGAFIGVLSKLSPEDLVLNVCEVIETCQHPILLQMRDSHHRRLHVPITVKNLDTGEMYGMGVNSTLVPLEDKVE